ncbi:MAG: DUF456 domain-containing protein [Deltaproteobacteria bacterium]
MNSDSLVLGLAIILMLIGLAGTIMPALPGVTLIFLTIAAYGWYEGFHSITAYYLIILAGLTLLSHVVEYLSAYWGAKKYGSSKYGTWGAIIGMLLGIFVFPPLGIFIGAFAGALVGEYITCKNWEKAARAGLGTLVGILSGMVFNVILALGMIISFFIIVF